MLVQHLIAISNCPFIKIFEGVAYPWEAISGISSFFENFSEFKILSPIDKGVILLNKSQIYIGRNVIVEPGAFIKGPVFIGDGSVIRHGAYIRPKSLIGDGVLVGHGSEIKHSILMNGAKAAHFNYVGDSIIGSNVNLGAGVICANLRHDRRNVKVCGKESSMKKLGAIIGDCAQIGCNCVINPGCLIAKGVACAPLTALSGFIDGENKE